MKDIKSLYLTAKNSRRSNDINAYTEAVEELLESSPTDFLSNLKYIITSDINLTRLDKFVEKYGISVAAYDQIIECLEECVGKCEAQNIDSSLYKEYIEKYEMYKDQYKSCFMMFESYFNNDPEYFKEDQPSTHHSVEEYNETFYSFNDKGVQNSKLIKGMIDKFGEMAIPDIIIGASRMGQKALGQVYKIFEKSDMITDPKLTQWLIECTCNIDGSESFIESISVHSLQSMVDDVINRNKQVYREAVIMGDTNAVMEYSDEDLQNIYDLIEFKEYMLTCTESADDALKIQKEIYSLYEEFDGIINEDGTLIEDTADSVLPMLPGSGNIDESKALANTTNKKTGSVPAYLGNNHDLGYGEDEPSKTEDDDPDINSLRRPSAIQDNDDTDSDDPDIEVVNNETSPKRDENQASINNYYYYTYTNSLNKNSHSNNVDKSIRDNHSTHDDHSLHTSNRRVTDDHSTGKRVNSNDYNGVEPEEKHESAKPWELNIFPTSRIYTEGFFDIFNRNKKKEEEYKKNKNTNTSDVSGSRRTETVIPLNEAEKNILISNIKKFETSVKNVLDPLLHKYPIYGMEFHLFDDWKDSSNPYDDLLWELSEYRKYLNPDTPYAIILLPDGVPYISCIDFEVSGLDQYDFMTMLGNEYPDEVKRIAALGKYNMDRRDDWTNIHWMEKLCGYDRCLDDITNEMIDIVKTKFPMVKDFSYGGDNDSGPLFSGELDLNCLFDGINISPSRSISVTIESVITESAGDADDMKPESDHPIKDTMMDIDRRLIKTQQKTKKRVQDIQNVGRAIAKPAVRTGQWISNMISQWKDKDETRLKEDLADPHARSGLFKAITNCIKTGSLMKAGLLFNPIFLFLSIVKKDVNNKKLRRIRNEMIGEIKTELAIIAEKIEDAKRNGDNKAKYRLMRLQNELNKKLLRVGGTRDWKKII